MNEMSAKDFILFTDDNIKNVNGGFLPKFFNFFHQINRHRLPRFSYIGEKAQLISNLGLKDNIMLDSINYSLSESKEFLLRHELKKSKNPALVELFRRLQGSNQLPKQVEQEMQSLAIIVKGLLAPVDVLLLDCIDSHLKKDLLDLLKQALNTMRQNSNLIILCYSHHPAIWQEMSNKKASFDLNGKIKLTILEENSEVLAFDQFKKSA